MVEMILTMVFVGLMSHAKLKYCNHNYLRNTKHNTFEIIYFEINFIIFTILSMRTKVIIFTEITKYLCQRKYWKSGITGNAKAILYIPQLLRQQ